jgi:GNAT superfamily N-acetyltransferase
MTDCSAEVRLITLNEENLGKVQMLCGHSPTYRRGYEAKVDWLRERLQEGMRYTLLQVQGRNAGMIETVPGEFAWRGVEAQGYLFIHCFWVVGRNRRHGYGRQLLQDCLEHARGTNGVAVVSSKTHWLPTRKIFIRNGFELADALPPFELLVNRFRPDAPLPHFKRAAPAPLPGLTLHQSDQCPYFQNLPAIVQQVGERLGVPVNVMHVESAGQAQNLPCPYGVLGIFYNGELIEYRPAGTKKLLEILETKRTGLPG